jgi:hypothetical protein
MNSHLTVLNQSLDVAFVRGVGCRNSYLFLILGNYIFICLSATLSLFMIFVLFLLVLTEHPPVAIFSLFGIAESIKFHLNSICCKSL